MGYLSTRPIAPDSGIIEPMRKPAEEIPIPPRLVKTKQAAEYLAISQWKLRNLVQQGLIPYIEDGGGTSPWRFDIRDLDEYVERSRRVL
jgi:excisionase family DNA binding protein